MPEVAHIVSFPGFEMLKEDILSHIKRHKVAYAFGAGVVVAGVVFYFTRDVYGPQSQPQILKDSVFSNFSPFSKVTYLNKNTVITSLERRGHPGKIIRCNETGEVFSSIQRGADVMEINRGNLTSHLHGRLPHAGGYTFEVLGEAA